MTTYSVELILRGSSVLVIGGGRVAVRKMAGLMASGAVVTLVAPEPSSQLAAGMAEVQKLSDCLASGRIRHLAEPFHPDHLEMRPRPVLVFAVTGSMALNRQIAGYCSEAGLLCNSADDPEVSGFLVPATIRRGALTVAVSSAGNSPALSRLLKERIDQQLEPGWEGVMELFGAMREQVRQALPVPEIRHRFWREMAMAAAAEERFCQTKDREGERNAEWFRQRLHLFQESVSFTGGSEGYGGAPCGRSGVLPWP